MQREIRNLLAIIALLLIAGACYGVFALRMDSVQDGYDREAERIEDAGSR